MTVLSRSKKAASTWTKGTGGETLVDCHRVCVVSVLRCFTAPSPDLPRPFIRRGSGGLSVVVCWSAKGGQGTSVVACALALVLTRDASTDVLLVDLAGDAPAVVGLPDSP